MCVRASVCARRWLWLIFNPFLLFQLSCEAHCLRSISYCKLIIFCWNCISVCVHMCVFECLLCMHLLCYCKQNDMAQYYFPSTISRPHACVFCCRCWMHQLRGRCKCISSVNHISLNLEDGEQEMEGGSRGGGYKVATPHSQLLVKKKKKKSKFKNLKMQLCALESLCSLNFKIPLAPLFFFPSCVYTSCKQSRSCFHGNIYLCEEFINPFSQEFHVEIPRRMQMGGVGGMLQCYFWQNLLFMKCNAFFFSI